MGAAARGEHDDVRPRRARHSRDWCGRGRLLGVCGDLLLLLLTLVGGRVRGGVGWGRRAEGLACDLLVRALLEDALRGRSRLGSCPGASAQVGGHTSVQLQKSSAA